MRFGMQLPIIGYVLFQTFFLIFKGPDAPHQIRLVKSVKHYDGCVSYPAFVNRSYCLKCKKGYNSEDVKHHPCLVTKCQACQRKGGCSIAMPKRYNQCFLTFNGDDCFSVILQTANVKDTENV